MTNTESQILSKYKWSSTADTHQNQLSNVQIAFCAQKKSLPGCTPVNLLSLGAPQFIQMHLSTPPRKSVSWQPVLSRGETGRIPQNKWFQWLLQMLLKIPVSGPVSPSSWLIATILALLWLSALLRKPREARYRENTAATPWAPKRYQKQGPAAWRF